MNNESRCAVPDCGLIAPHQLLLLQKINDPMFLNQTKKMYLCDKHFVDMYEFLSAYEGKVNDADV